MRGQGLGRGAVAVALAAATLLVTGVLAALAGVDEGGLPEAAAREIVPAVAVPVPLPTLPVTIAPTTTPPAVPPPTTTPVPPPALLPSPGPLAAVVRTGNDAYKGLGTWIDVYDWSAAFGKDGPLVVPDDVDRMAAVGVQTLYVQTTKWDAGVDVLEPERLLPIIERARQRGLRVVAWYLPTLEDPVGDLRRLVAAARLGVDSLAVDIESRRVSDVAERNRRLVQLAADLRRTLPDMALGGIVLPPVVMENVNPRYWPAFPWHQLAPHFDVWLPMAYWTDRTGQWRDAYRYTAWNIARVRQNLDRPSAPVHFIGGIGNRTTAADVAGMNKAATENGTIGASLYDWRTTSAALWPHLQSRRA